MTRASQREAVLPAELPTQTITAQCLHNNFVFIHISKTLHLRPYCFYIKNVSNIVSQLGANEMEFLQPRIVVVIEFKKYLISLKCHLKVNTITHITIHKMCPNARLYFLTATSLSLSLHASHYTVRTHCQL